MRGFLLGSVLLWGGGAPAWADPPGSAQEEPATGTVVPPGLLAQAELRYPDEAVADGAHGDVSVLVDVSSTGEVVGTRFESGPEVFRQVALEAAAQLRFSAATRDGVPVAATTRVWFHFAPPEAEPEDGDMAEIVVHADDPDQEDTHARTTLGAAELEQAAGEDLARTIDSVAGVRAASGTQGAAKPIIRGQVERRLLLIDDGVRHESQKWGLDHATEVDPFTAGSISIIRGAAGVRYGPDAIGGVLLIEPPPLRSAPGVGGTARLAFASNGLRPYAALRLDAVPAAMPGLTLRLEGNAAVGASLSAPDYVLGNTAGRTFNGGTTVGYVRDATQLRATWHHHDMQAGVFYGVSNSTPQDFLDQLDSAPVGADQWTIDYAIDRPFQSVTHDIGRLSLVSSGELGELDAVYAFQLNRRREYDQVRDAVTGPQYDFTLRTHSLDAAWRHRSVLLGPGVLRGTVGLQGLFQENVYAGYALLPNYRDFQGGAFAIERLSWSRLDLEIGGRIDGLRRGVFLDEDDYAEHLGRGTLSAERCEEGSGTRTRCAHAWETGSVSAGALVHLVPERADVKLDISSASRFPDLDELYLAGAAPSLPVYAVGSPELGVETAWSASLTGALRLSWLELELSAYASLIEDYIYFAPDLGSDSLPNYEVTIRGSWPRYDFTALDATSWGIDASTELGADWPLGVRARGSLVRTQDLASGEHLVGTPADRLVLTLVGRPPETGALSDVQLLASVELVGRQSRVAPAADFAPAPGGYVLLDLGVQGQVHTGWQPVRIGLEVRNVLDTAYREYTSLLRYYADMPGRDVRLRVGLDF